MEESSACFYHVVSPPAPILRANVFGCDQLASAWQRTVAQAAIMSRQTRHSRLSWHVKTCWWLMIGLQLQQLLDICSMNTGFIYS